MRLQRLFYCAVAGLGGAAAITLMAGESGRIAFRAAAEYRDRLAAGIDDLQSAHARLQRELELLQSDAEVVRLAARELGYYRPGETVVSILDDSGRGAVAARSDSFDATYYAVGPLVRERVPVVRRGVKTLPMGLSLGAGLFILVTIADTLRAHRRSGDRSQRRSGDRSQRRSGDRAHRRRGGRGAPARAADAPGLRQHFEQHSSAAAEATQPREEDWVAGADGDSPSQAGQRRPRGPRAARTGVGA